MEIGTILHGFLLENIQQVPDLHATAYRFAHEKSGARLLWLSNDDIEKAFSIGFKTIPQDNTGVFHILEHSVLCGSEKYPVKEPFVDLLKTSMQTFLNAMTFPDKTMYPVASPNEKDFLNLIGVYMDAVLHPRIYQKKEIFMQEGWHLELPEDGAPAFNGVVYNEMKGVYSNADSLLDEYLNRAMFPDTTYSSNSGGWPAEIPTLTYEHFLAEHKKYYHPENSYIFLYGEMDIDRILGFLDDEYLSRYDREGNQFEIESQKPLGFSKKNATYMVGAGEPLENNALVGSAFLAGEYNDREDNLALELILEALASTNDSPLKKAMLDRGFGQDFSAFLYNGIKQNYAVCVLRKADENRADEYEAALRETVEKIASEGIDREALTAALNAREFACRENDHYGPAGIGLAVEAMNGWLYGDDPVPYLSSLDVIAALRQKFVTDYPEQLLRRIFCESPHSAMVVLTPSATMAEEDSAAEKERAAAYAASLSEEEMAAVRADNEKLAVFQNSEDTPEAKATLPVLSLSDLSRDPTPEIPTLTDCRDGVIRLFHPLPTSGILYTSLYFDISSLPFEDMSALSLVCRMLGDLPTEHYSAIGLDTAIKTDLGMLDFETSVVRDRRNGAVRRFVVARASALAANTAKILPLVRECALHTLFDPQEVLKLLRQEVIYGEQYIVGAGHMFAVNRASAAASEEGKYNDAFDGYGYLTFIRGALADFGDGAAFSDRLAKLCAHVFGDCLKAVSCSSEEKDYPAFLAEPLGFVRNTGDAHTAMIYPAYAKSQAVRIPAAVAFDAACMDFAAAGAVYSGKMGVLSRILSLDYLWNAVRVRGGAYGVGMAASEGGGLFTFYSYRDPSVGKTYDAYRASAEYLRGFSADEKTMAGYIIGYVSSSDRPLRPKTQSRIADLRYFAHITREERVTRRAEALSVTSDDIRGYADVLAASAEHMTVCTVASSEKIDADIDRFETVTE